MNEWMNEKKSETKWGKQVRDELVRVAQKQSETNSNQKLGSKRIKETKTCVLIGITWKMCKCCETTWALHKSKKWDFGVFERQDLMRICKALCCEKTQIIEQPESRALFELRGG